MNICGLYSAGGFAREIRSSLVHFFEESGQERFEVVYIDGDTSKSGKFIYGSRVASYDAFRQFDKKADKCCFC